MDLLYEYTATGTPSPKELTLCTCPLSVQLSNFFLGGGGEGGGGRGGQAGGEDLIDTASPVVAVLTLHVHACLRVEMLD